MCEEGETMQNAAAIQPKPFILPDPNLLKAGGKPGPKPTPPNQAAPKAPRFYYPPATDTFQYKLRSKTGMQSDRTQVQSLLGGEQIFKKVEELLDSAKSWVLVDYYTLQSPELYPERSSPAGTPGADIQAKLIDKLIDLKKNKNINVRVILDNSKQNGPSAEIEEFQNTRTIQKLQENGIEVLPYPRDVSHISHVKIVMADNRQAIIGGMNWGNHSPTNHDGAVYINGPDVRNIFTKVFKPDWITAGGDTSKLPPMTPFRAGHLKVLQTAGKHSEQGTKNEILQEILHQIDQAQNSIHAQLFVLTHKEVVNSLLQKHRQLKKAGKEGVKLLVDPGLYFAFPNCRPGIQKLAAEGVPIRFFKANRDDEEKLHAKWAVFDRKNLLVGSANWSAIGLDSDTKQENAMDVDDGSQEAIEEESEALGFGRSLKTNHEVALLIEDAAEVAKTFALQADYDFKNVSFPILKKGDDGKWHPIKPNQPAIAKTTGMKGLQRLFSLLTFNQDKNNEKLAG
jgi:phosphatidylserine/phosphatidylglycerophosphate/cardiolipin synthase-like enzyme